jgi:ATP-dependent DNA helicase RecG
MVRKTEFKGLSRRARLLLNRDEGYDVEFKRSLGGLDAHDIAAFANSEVGGAILIGIEEVATGEGRQEGRIRGCPVGDREKQSIINKAESCIPPVDIEIFVENSNRTPFYRIEIPSGSRKPYCTAGGTYKIRGDGRTKPLLPGRLLFMFVETESQKFIERFREATTELETSLMDTKSRVIEEMHALLSTTESMEIRIERSLGRIFDSAANAEALSDEAMTLSDMALGGIDELYKRIEEIDNRSLPVIEEKIDALLNNFGIEDPNIARSRRQFKEMIEALYKSEAGEQGVQKFMQETLERLPVFLPPATVEDLMLWCEEKIEELESKGDVS